MKKQEAEVVIEALESGKSFEFSNCHAGVREVLEYDKSSECFVFVTHYAYEPDVDRKTFTRNELNASLQNGFSYKDFNLPPVKSLRNL